MLVSGKTNQENQRSAISRQERSTHISKGARCGAPGVETGRLKSHPTKSG